MGNTVNFLDELLWSLKFEQEFKQARNTLEQAKDGKQLTYDQLVELRPELKPTYNFYLSMKMRYPAQTYYK